MFKGILLHRLLVRVKVAIDRHDERVRARAREAAMKTLSCSGCGDPLNRFELAAGRCVECLPVASARTDRVKDRVPPGAVRAFGKGTVRP